MPVKQSSRALVNSTTVLLAIPQGVLQVEALSEETVFVCGAYALEASNQAKSSSVITYASWFPR